MSCSWWKFLARRWLFGATLTDDMERLRQNNFFLLVFIFLFVASFFFSLLSFSIYVIRILEKTIFLLVILENALRVQEIMLCEDIFTRYHPFLFRSSREKMASHHLQNKRSNKDLEHEINILWRGTKFSSFFFLSLHSIFFHRWAKRIFEEISIHIWKTFSSFVWREKKWNHCTYYESGRFFLEFSHGRQCRNFAGKKLFSCFSNLVWFNHTFDVLPSGLLGRAAFDWMSSEKMSKKLMVS